MTTYAILDYSSYPYYALKLIVSYFYYAVFFDTNYHHS